MFRLIGKGHASMLICKLHIPSTFTGGMFACAVSSGQLTPAGTIGRNIVVAFNIAWGVFILASAFHLPAQHT